MINSTVTRISDLIDNILDFARGRLGGDARPLEPVLVQVVDELRTASPQRVIETSFEITGPVNCDRTRIGQLASNLIGNALPMERATSQCASGQERKVTNSDSGSRTPGNLFQKRQCKDFSSRSFAAWSATAVRVLGLGLHIASQIAQAHGGRIDVTSAADETRFVFTMPLTQT